MGQLRLTALLNPTETTFAPNILAEGTKSGGKGIKQKKPQDGKAELNRNTHRGDSVEEEKQEYDKGTALGEQGRGCGDHGHQDGHDKDQAHVEQHPRQPGEKRGE